MSRRILFPPFSGPHFLRTTPKILYSLRTLYLFIKSDIVGIMMPIIVFATLTTHNKSLIKILQASTWTAAHLLQFCVSNQSLSPEEDRKNKPWRPIPSGRLTVAHAYTLRWTLLPACLALSTMYNVLDVSIMLCVAIFLHNEVKYDKHWFARALLNAAAYAAFDAGATLVSYGDRQKMITVKAVLPLAINTFIIVTTIHAQDFRDEEGDRHEGRRTIPIVAPRFGRLSMPVLLLTWACILMPTHRAWTMADWSVLLLACLVGLRFYYIRTPTGDRASYALYNIWLLSVRVSLFLSQDMLGAHIHNRGRTTFIFQRTWLYKR